MSILKTLGGGVTAVVLLVVLILLIVALSATVGGLVGAGIAAGYNILLGQSFAVWDAALIGSIVGVAGGTSASSE